MLVNRKNPKKRSPSEYPYKPHLLCNSGQLEKANSSLILSYNDEPETRRM
jgi:hypothetical protein